MGTCFAVKPGFRNHLRLPWKYSSMLPIEILIKKTPTRKHLQIFIGFSKVSASVKFIVQTLLA